MLPIQPSNNPVVDGRVRGELFGVSVGTALALEALTDSSKLKGYTDIYINVQTLFRNLYGAYKPEFLPTDVNVLVKALCDELVAIGDIISLKITPTLHITYYLTTNLSLVKKMPRAKHRTANTDKQKYYEKMEKTVITKALDRVEKEDIKLFDIHIKGDNKSAIMISHYPIDLLSHYSFRKLTLLESHTGVLKNKNEWITKITNLEGTRNIPFNVFTVQVFGDKNNRLNTMDRKIVKLVLTMANDYSWHASTTLEKIKFDCDKLKDRYSATVIREMCNVKLI
jgi:hypothetical protein